MNVGEAPGEFAHQCPQRGKGVAKITFALIWVLLFHKQLSCWGSLYIQRVTPTQTVWAQLGPTVLVTFCLSTCLPVCSSACACCRTLSELVSPVVSPILSLLVVGSDLVTTCLPTCRLACSDPVMVCLPTCAQLYPQFSSFVSPLLPALGDSDLSSLHLPPRLCPFVRLLGRIGKACISSVSALVSLLAPAHSDLVSQLVSPVLPICRRLLLVSPLVSPLVSLRVDDNRQIPNWLFLILCTPFIQVNALSQTCSLSNLDELTCANAVWGQCWCCRCCW